MAGMAAPHRIRRSLAVALVVLLPLGAVAACGDDGDSSDDAAATDATASDDPAATDGAGSDEPATDAPASDEPSTDDEGGESPSTEPDEGGVDADLVGDWTAPAQDVLASNLANVGGPSDVTCDGVVTLSIRDDGTFAQTAEATCQLMGQSASIVMDSSGTYEASDGTVVIDESENNGTYSVAGMTQPLSSSSSGEAQYTIDGDTLTIVFSDPSVGDITQIYGRA